MDAELYTRNSMNGLVLIFAFLIVFVWSGKSLEKLDEISQHYLITTSVKTTKSIDGTHETVREQKPLLDNGFWTFLLGTLIAAPTFGFVISSLVLFAPRLVGIPYPYHGRPGKEFLLWLKKRDFFGKSFCDHEPVFAYLLYQEDAGKRIEWGRRRHTAQLMYMNWSVAAFIGLALGLYTSFKLTGWLPQFLWPILIGVAFCVMWIILSVVAGRQAEQFDALLMENIKQGI